MACEDAQQMAKSVAKARSRLQDQVNRAMAFAWVFERGNSKQELGVRLFRGVSKLAEERRRQKQILVSPVDQT